MRSSAFFCCGDRRGRRRLLRRRGVGRRRPDRGARGNGGFCAQAVHRCFELYFHGLPADLARHHGLRRDRRWLRLAEPRRAVGSAIRRRRLLLIQNRTTSRCLAPRPTR